MCAPMAEESDAERKLYDERAGKAKQLLELGINPYGNGFSPDSLAADLHARYDGVEPASLEAT